MPRVALNGPAGKALFKAAAEGPLADTARMAAASP